MKKVLLISIVLMAETFSLMAQDTLEMFDPKWNYYVNSWPDSSKCYDPNYVESLGRCDMWALNFYTQDTLTIYGIATVVFQFPEYDLAGTEDKDPTHAVEYMLLFEHDSTLHLRQVAESLSVCIATDSVAYYWKLEHGSGFVSAAVYNLPDAVPVYERYFSQPYKIVDTFYVGMTTRFWECTNPYSENGVRIYSFATLPQYNWMFCTCMKPAPYLFYHHYRSDGHWEGDSTYHIFIMPIIDIDTAYWPGRGDTTERAGEDTTGHVEAVEVAAANRFVAVNPNPAKGEVKVMSTVGMRKVEVYSAEGVKVVEKETAEGEVQTRLDVSRLHGGSYVVRVYTSVGMAIKKLVVQ